MADTLKPGPAPTGRDKIFDALYGVLGGKPENRWAADKLTTAVDWGTLGMLTGAYDGGQSLAKGEGPGQLAMALMPGAKPVGAAAKVATTAAREVMPAARDAVQGIRAFHGSPHDFDRFSLDKIGTGEGAQAYGHGLYFAENEGVARQYRDDLSKFKTYPEEIARNALKENGDDKTRAIADLLNSRNEAQKLRDFEHVALVDMSIDALQKGRIAGPNYEKGRMYEVNIKANPDDFLDWDKPLSQHSEKVRSAVEPLVRSEAEAERLRREAFRRTSDARMRAMGMDPGPAPPIKSVDDMLRDFSPDMFVKGNEEALRAAGIPGVKYLDQGSRAGGEGSRNLVVFDDSLIEILRKYGLLPPAALGAAAATQDPAQASP